MSKSSKFDNLLNMSGINEAVNSAKLKENEASEEKETTGRMVYLMPKKALKILDENNISFSGLARRLVLDYMKTNNIM